MKNSSNLNISCKVVFSLNKWNKKVGSPSSFGRQRPFISLNSSASIGNPSSSERARARAPANHAKNDAQKGCAMQLNGITLSFHSGQTHDACAVPAIILQKKIQTNVESFTLTGKLNAISESLFISFLL